MQRRSSRQRPSVGRATKSIERVDLTPEEESQRREAKQSLKYPAEQTANLLKGEATKRLVEEELHPQANFADEGGKAPSPWVSRKWKVYLDSEEAIENAIRYVVENPVNEGKPRQKWSFVTPFAGLDPGQIVYHSV